MDANTVSDVETISDPQNYNGTSSISNTEELEAVFHTKTLSAITIPCNMSIHRSDESTPHSTAYTASATDGEEGTEVHAEIVKTNSHEDGFNINIDVATGEPNVNVDVDFAYGMNRPIDSSTNLEEDCGTEMEEECESNEEFIAI